MKKLSLKKLNLQSNDLLQREQLKTVFGGYEGHKKKCETCSGNSQCGPAMVCVHNEVICGDRLRRCW